jgi:hypothetical protein
MRNHALRSRRGVTLIEGMISTVILLTGMVGILQGLAFASMQNTMANRQTRASIIAQELIVSLEQQGRAQLYASGGLFTSAECSTSVGTLGNFRGDLAGPSGELPPSIAGYTVCFIAFDSKSAFQSITPGYTTQDRAVYERMVAVYTSAANPALTYVGVNVGWKDGGFTRIAKRFTAIIDTNVNQTNLEF